jgi:hypothetical protein
VAVPPHAVPAHLARAGVLLLSLADDLFGRALTSPLKLWDYLAVGAPIVAPDLPTVRAIAPEAHLYGVGDPEDLARAVTRALASLPPTPRLRTWETRAAEVESVLEFVLEAALEAG